MRPSYTTLTEVESQTREGVKYVIKRDDRSGHLSCSCPSFRFQKKEVDARWCKHTIAIEQIGVEKFVVKAKTSKQEWVREEDLIVWATV